MPTPVTYRDIPPEDWNEIGSRLQFDPRQTEAFASAVSDIVRAIVSSNAIPPEQRRQQRQNELTALGKTADILAHLGCHIKSLDDGQAEALDEALSREMGRMLSTTAILELLGIFVDGRDPQHQPEIPETTGGSGWGRQ